jgi:peptidoglycan/xylan/chitin deacetylase (PgdA/CDA1 family)
MYLRLQLSDEEGYQQYVDTFDVLYEESATASKVMAISLHPYIIGVPHRIRVLDRVLSHIASHDGVWFAQAHEIDQWYRTTYMS